MHGRIDSVLGDRVTVVFKQKEELWLRKSLHRYSMELLPVELEYQVQCARDVTGVYKKRQLLLLKDND